MLYVAGDVCTGDATASRQIHVLAHSAKYLGELLLKLGITLDRRWLRRGFAARRHFLGERVGEINKHLILGDGCRFALQFHNGAGGLIAVDEQADATFACRLVRAFSQLAFMLLLKPLDGRLDVAAVL